MDGSAGVTVMESSVAAVTVKVVEPVIAPEVAEISEVPTFNVEARPAELMVAVAEVFEAQITLPVRFCVLPSE